MYIMLYCNNTFYNIYTISYIVYNSIAIAITIIMILPITPYIALYELVPFKAASWSTWATWPLWWDTFRTAAAGGNTWARRPELLIRSISDVGHV